MRQINNDELVQKNVMNVFKSYNIDSVDAVVNKGEVTLFGVIPSQEFLADCEKSIRKIPGVSKIVDHVFVNNNLH
jgi:osmotically-inducible protein OsmY